MCLHRSHTCFYQIDLPPYPTADMMFAKMIQAITLGMAYAEGLMHDT